MQYTTLGRTGLKVSRLGFGAMRLPMNGEQVNDELAIPMIHRAFEAGVTYMDTAVFYCNQDSQRVVGKALKGWREKVVLSTKNHCFEADEKAWWTHLENSLERLDVETIDIYNTHGINAQKYDEFVVPHISKWLDRAKEQGLIRHICTSFHGSREFFRRMVDDGRFETVTIQYNMLNREFEDEIAYAKAAGMGIVVMGPVGGGRLGGDSEVLAKLVPDIKRIPELALRFVLANPNVDIALSGMSTLEQVIENAEAASIETPLTEAERAIIDEQIARLAEMAKLYCTGCDYCKPCPTGVNISRIFSIYNTGRVYGLWDHAREQYARMEKAQRDNQLSADHCIDCGQCRPKCPQGIDIPEQLRKAHEALKTED
jgi:predicted aldo/keto reductase-like oxidoreductase